jgi:hypothetical protein
MYVVSIFKWIFFNNITIACYMIDVLQLNVLYMQQILKLIGK